MADKSDMTISLAKILIIFLLIITISSLIIFLGWRESYYELLSFFPVIIILIISAIFIFITKYENIVKYIFEIGMSILIGYLLLVSALFISVKYPQNSYNIVFCIPFFIFAFYVFKFKIKKN